MYFMKQGVGKRKNGFVSGVEGTVKLLVPQNILISEQNLR